MDLKELFYTYFWQNIQVVGKSSLLFTTNIEVVVDAQPARRELEGVKVKEKDYPCFIALDNTSLTSLPG